MASGVCQETSKASQETSGARQETSGARLEASGASQEASEPGRHQEQQNVSKMPEDFLFFLHRTVAEFEKELSLLQKPHAF